jgi:hypothetical protein
MATLTINALDGHMRRYHNVLGSLGSEKTKIVMMRTLNAQGDKMRTQVRRAVAKQTGLKRDVIVRAIKRKGASTKDLTYELKAKGGNVRLRFFRPAEFRYGTRAFPRSKATRFPGAFLKGGLFPSRVPIRINPTGRAVLERTGAGRFPIREVRSDVYIPDELVAGQSEAAFLATPPEIIKQLDRQIGAIFRGF